MKVLHVVNISFVLPYYIGGQFDYFNEKGIQFYVACAASNHLAQYAEEKQFKYFTVKILRVFSPIRDLIAIYRLITIIKAEKFEIVIGHTPKAAMIAMIASYLSGVKKRIYFRHGLMYETSKGIKRFILKSIEKLTGNLATKVVCVSNSVMVKSVSEHLNSASKNLILSKGTCNGIDINKFSKTHLDSAQQTVLRTKNNIQENDFVIGYVGRLVKDKGINELILAWKTLLKDRRNIKLLLVGPFEDRDAINAESRSVIENEPSIIHLGLISDVIPYYGLMNIFILPSYREGFPTVVLEASSMEVPIITTRATGCVEAIIENETGIFCEISEESIAEKIDFYLSNHTLAYDHGRQGREFVVQNFQAEKIWQEIEKRVFEVNN